MTEREYNQMKAVIDAERDTEIAAANDKHRLSLEHIDFVWQKFNGGLFAKDNSKAAEPMPTERGSLITGLKTAIMAMEKFTIDDLIARMNALDPELRATDRKVSITSNVSRLNKAKELEVLEPGRRGRPQVYRKSTRFTIDSGSPREIRKGEVK